MARRSTLSKGWAGILMASCITLFTISALHAQTPPAPTDWGLMLEGSVISQNDKTKINGAKVTVLRNGARSDQVMSDAKGKFTLRLPPDAKYILEFSFPGYVTKRISFSTKMVPTEASSAGDFLFRFDMTLFKEMEGLDVAILNKPLAEVTFDPNLQDFNYDKEYTKSVQAQIETLQADLEAKLLAEAEAHKEVEKQYQKSMADGAKLMTAGDFGGAKTAFAAALVVKAGDPSATSKLDEAQKKYDKDLADKQGEKAYKTAIENAELALHEDNLKGAETEFQKALDAKPGDIYARDQLKEVKDKIVSQAKAEQTYIAAIGKADAALAVKDYITAKAEYTKALQAKPQDKYAIGQLAQTDGMLAADAKKESEYLKAIERGEVAMESKDYEAAKAAFELAGSTKPGEKYPKEQLTKIAALMADIELQSKKYQDAIKRGDAAFAAKDFPTAKIAYEEAVALNPSQQYPKDQLAAISKKMAELAQVETQYVELMKDAEQRYTSKDYIAAKAQYVKALGLKPNEELPQKRINEISAILEKDAKLEAEYKSTISNADNAFNAKDYNSAKFEYETASKLKPEEAYPKGQLGKIAVLLAELAKKDESYTKAIAEGDANMKAELYDKAKASYIIAATVKPEEKYPAEQIKIIDAKIIELASLKKQYDENIAIADKLYEGDKLAESKSSYEKALSILPSEPYPKEKIALITAAIAEGQKKDQEYTSLIASADGAFNKKDYAGAKTSYAAASALKAQEKYPKDKIAEIDQLLVKAAETQKLYDATIAKADASFNANKLEEALPLYQQAAGIKEGESWPINQITLIEGKLSEKKKMDQAYAASITKAESAEKAGDLAGAIAEFKNASSVKPEEAYPKEKIAALGATLAENQKKDEDYNAALKMAEDAKNGKEFDIALTQFRKASELKPTEVYPKEQIKEVEGLKAASLAAITLAKKQDDDYKAAIAEADALFAKQQYQESKKKYQASLAIKPTEEYPKGQISEIDKAMASQLQEKEKKDKYAALIAAGDKAFLAKSWQQARASFQEASAVMPQETYPTEKIKAIDLAMGEEAALASQKEKDQKYQAFIASADNAFKAKDWQKAKSDYQQAAVVKPEEKYPADQLKAIDIAISEEAALASQMEKEAAARELDKKYSAFISVADKAFAAKDWQNARSNYEQASAVKPQEKYPADQLNAIEAAIVAAAALASQQEKEAGARAKDEKYASLIASADKSFKAKDWENARAAYKEAAVVKPEETYPGTQLKAIDAAVAEAAALASKQEKESAAKAKEEKYKFLIVAADQAFRSKDWEEARTNYKEAALVKPEETYPAEQLKAIDKAISDQGAMAAQMEKDALERQKNEKYSAAIAAADKAFAAKQWENARINYKQALEIKPAESHPKERLALIDNEILAQTEGDKKKQYDAYLANADRAFKSKDWSSARTNYQSALSVMPDEVYPKDQLSKVNEAEAKDKEIALSMGKEEAYKQAIGDADQLYNNSDYTASKAKYEEALSMKPTEVYPKNRIQDINQKLASAGDAAKLAAEYQKFIDQGDAEFGRKEYEAARGSYNQALGIKSTESYPKGKIKEIDGLLAAQRANDLAGKQADTDKQRKYDNLIAEADKNFSAKNYTSAKSNYTSALSVKPEESYPKTKLQEIDELLAKKEVRPEPVAKKSSGMSEAEIAAMMAKWQQERDQGKTDRLNQQIKDLEVTSEDRSSNAEDRRQDTKNDLADLEKSITETNQAGKDKNLDEAKLIEEQRSDQINYIAQKSGESERARNDLYADIVESEEGQKELREKGNQLYQVNTELVTTEKIEQIREEKERGEEGHRSITVNYEEIASTEKAIDKDRESRSDAHMKDVDNIKKENELVLSSIRTWTDESRESRSDAYEEIVKLETDIVEFQEERSESFRPNTEKYYQDIEELDEYQERQAKDAKGKRNKAYGEIEDYSKEVAEVTQERHNKYDENNREISKEQKAIVDDQSQLAAEADERRMRFDRNYYTGEKKARYPEIAREHRQGVTEESFEQDNAYVIKRMVVDELGINEYEKIFYKWGAVYYKKNGNDITEVIWNTETQ